MPAVPTKYKKTSSPSWCWACKHRTLQPKTSSQKQSRRCRLCPETPCAKLRGFASKRASVSRPSFPAQREAPPKRSVSPNIVEHTTGRAPTRTYRNLLTGSYEEALFDYYFRAALTRIGTDGSMRTFSASAGPLARVQPSPDGSFALVVRLERPYYHMLPASRFPRTIERWDLHRGSRIDPPGLPQQEDITPTRGRPLPTLAWRPGPATAIGWQGAATATARSHPPTCSRTATFSAPDCCSAAPTTARSRPCGYGRPRTLRRAPLRGPPLLRA